MQQEPLLVNRKIAAQLLGISVRTLDYMISRREIAVKHIGARVLVPVRELHRISAVRKPLGKQASEEVIDNA
jgi:hypothetical protein